MNNTFNIKRFGLLLKKTLLERPVQMFGFTVLLLALVLILYVIAKRFSGFIAAQNLAFIWGLPGGSFFLASFVFGYFSSNASGSSFLTLPASHFEKWLCGVLIAGVLYPLIFLIFYRIMDTSFVALYHNSWTLLHRFINSNMNQYTFLISMALLRGKCTQCSFF